MKLSEESKVGIRSGLKMRLEIFEQVGMGLTDHVVIEQIVDYIEDLLALDPELLKK